MLMQYFTIPKCVFQDKVASIFHVFVFDQKELTDKMASYFRIFVLINEMSFKWKPPFENVTKSFAK